jgi:hypothetical protein
MVILHYHSYGIAIPRRCLWMNGGGAIFEFDGRDVPVTNNNNVRLLSLSNLTARDIAYLVASLRTHFEGNFHWFLPVSLKIFIRQIWVIFHGGVYRIGLA